MRRLEPNQPVSLQQLAELGVLYWRLDADKWENDPKLDAIRKVRGYSYIVRAGAPSSAARALLAVCGAAPFHHRCHGPRSSIP